MVKLSGILEYSMGGFLCLRGFASFKMLSAISEPNPEVHSHIAWLFDIFVLAWQKKSFDSGRRDLPICLHR